MKFLLKFFSNSRPFSLKKSKNVYWNTHALLQKKRKKLSKEEITSVEKELQKLKEALIHKDRKAASDIAKYLLTLSKTILKKPPIRQFVESTLGIAFALFVALVIRQTWFEHHKIPTGSMRPTFFEEDHLITSKTTFGVNVPFNAAHFYFNPDKIERMGIIVFNTKDLDMRDNSYRYFYLLPGYKRLVKRVIGKPGDTLYFYGGKIYGIDKSGRILTELQELSDLHNLEHIPYIHLEGNAKTTNGNSFELYQMNQPVAQLTIHGHHSVSGKVFDGSSWKPESNDNNLFKKWGLGNYASVRLLTHQQILETAAQIPTNLEPAPFYLQIHHSLSVNQVHMGMDVHGQIRPILTPKVSYIPLEEKHIQALKDALYTTRFAVENGKAKNISYPTKLHPSLQVSLEDVPDGVYEFYYGTAYKVGSGGLKTKLSKDHPLYQDKYFPILFNQGMQMLTLYQPNPQFNEFYPNRYAYYRNGDLYVMGKPIFEQNDPVLKDFIASEQAKADRHPSYHPFVDSKPPFNKDGSLNKEFIQKHGLHIPEGKYLVLGDNHAGSSDSRDFGFIPEKNIEGTPSLMLWPNFGKPKQVDYHATWKFPNLLVGSIFLSSLGVWIIINYKKRKIK